MADFLATLNDTNGDLSIAVSNGIISVTDYSNYDTSTEDGHEQADFASFRQIIFDLPDGNTYTLSTTYPTVGDKLIAVPSVSTPPIVDNFTYTTGDGVYTATLITIPDYDNAVAYLVAKGHCVYYLGKIYKVLANTTGNLPTDITKWVEVIDYSTLPLKYRFSEQFAIYCDSQTCYARLLAKAICESGVIGCNYEYLFKNRNFINSLKLDSILSYIQILIDNDDWDAVTNCINQMKSICCCNK